MNITAGLEFASPTELRGRLAELPGPGSSHIHSLDYRDLNTATLAHAWTSHTRQPLRAGWEPSTQTYLLAEISLHHRLPTLLRWPLQVEGERPRSSDMTSVEIPEMPREGWKWWRHGCEYLVVDLRTGAVPFFSRNVGVAIDADKTCGSFKDARGLTLSQWAARHAPVPPDSSAVRLIPKGHSAR